ncbi:MAG TPA: DinB family protein [Dehalococcoidia bacterium]
MDKLWTASLSHGYGALLSQLERAINDCPDALWEASLWEVKKEDAHVWPVRRASQKKPGPAATQLPLLQVYSAFWNVAYHTLFHLDFYLSGAVLKGFAPPAPFLERDHHAHVIPDRTYTRAELLQYVAYNREKAQATIESLTDEQAHRAVARAGVPFGEFLVTTLMHAQEHAAQLQLFLGQNDARRIGAFESKTGIAPQQGQQMLRDGVIGRSDEEIDAFAKSVRGYAGLLPLVLGGLCARLQPGELCTVRFDIGDLQYAVRCKPGKATFDKRALKDPDATIAISPQDFLRWMVADLDVGAALKSGRIGIEGDRAAFARLLGIGVEQ